MLQASTATQFSVATPPTAEPLAFVAHGELTALLIATLDVIDYGVMVLDADSGHVHHANRMARDACVDGVLRIERGRLRAHERDNQRKLERALLLAAQDRRSLVELPPQGGGEPVLLAVVPLRADAQAPRALLLFGKRQLCESLSVGFFARLHALTPTEDAVLKALCSGMKPAQIAARSGVAISTVRTQVSSIRLKTCSESIRDLVKKVAVLPPIAPALLGAGVVTH